VLAAENTSEAQVKCGKIRQNRKRGIPPLDFGNQALPCSTKRRQFAHDFHDAKHTHVRSVDDCFDAGFTHPGTTHAKQVHIGSPSQRHGQPCGIHIAGSFAGGD
jgi:hypothetical protein